MARAAPQFTCTACGAVHRKWSGQCDGCGAWCEGKDVAVHHKQACGELRAFSDLPGFVERLFSEREGFIVLCGACHAAEHKESK